MPKNVPSASKARLKKLFTMNLKKIVLAETAKSKARLKGCCVMVKVNDLLCVTDKRTIERCKKYANERAYILKEKNGVLIIPSLSENSFINHFVNIYGLEILKIKISQKLKTKIAVIAEVLAILEQDEQEFFLSKKNYKYWIAFKRANPTILMLFEFKNCHLAINEQANDLENYLNSLYENSSFNFLSYVNSDKINDYDIFKILVIPSESKDVFFKNLEMPYILFSVSNTAKFVRPENSLTHYLNILH